MQSAGDSVTITLRLPVTLHEAVKGLAKRRRSSVNSVIVEGVSGLVRSAEDQALYDAFTLVGADLGGSDVDWMLPIFMEATGDAS